MQFQRAIISEEGVTYAIVTVEQETLNSKTEREGVRQLFESIYKKIPLILQTNGNNGIINYEGRTDIIDYLKASMLQ